MTKFRYLFAAIALFALAYAPPAIARSSGLDDAIASQTSHAPRLYADAAPTVVPAPAAVAPAPAPTVVVTPAPAPENPFGFLVDLAFVGLGVLVSIFLPRIWKGAPPAATEAILKIIDNGFDLASVEVKKLLPTNATPIDFHNETLNSVEKFVLTFATPAQMRSLGLTSANLRQWLAAEFAPAAEAEPVVTPAASATAAPGAPGVVK